MARVTRLWGREFSIVKEGLSQEEVMDFVNELLSKQKPSEEFAHITSLRKLAEQTVIEADKLALSIRREAEEQATRIIAEAKSIMRDAEEQAARTTVEAEQKARAIVEEAMTVSTAVAAETESILRSASERAAALEQAAREETQQLLLRSKQIVEQEIEETFKKAYQKLFADLEAMAREARALESGLRGRALNISARASERAEEQEATAKKEPPPQKEEGAAVSAPRQDRAIAIQFDEVTFFPGPASQPANKEGLISVAKAESPPQEADLALAQAIPQEATATLEVEEGEVFPSPEEAIATAPKEGDADLYQGKVDLIIAPPADLARLTELRRTLEKFPQLTIVETANRGAEGASITISVGCAIPLVNFLKDMPMVKAAIGGMKDQYAGQRRILVVLKKEPF